MHPLLLLAAVSPLAGVSALQLPLIRESQAPISTTKGLVSSSALQGDISATKLQKRAEALFEIAKLGEDEYNHPTRVIGSKGKSLLYVKSC